MADLIDRAEIVSVAEKAFDAWNLAMATADGQQEINLCFKRQELCKAVKAVAKAAPAVEAELVIHAHWKLIGTVQAYGMVYECSVCKRQVMHEWDAIDVYQEYPHCHCGARMDKEVDANAEAMAK